MAHPTKEDAVIQVLRASPGEWLSSSQIARRMPRRVAVMPKNVSGILRLVCAEKKAGIERRVDPVNWKRFYRYVDK